MEKVVFYKVYKFEDTRTGEKFYFENKDSAEMARFSVYSRYDGERISTRNFVVPVTKVKPVLILESELDKFIVRKGFQEYNTELAEIEK